MHPAGRPRGRAPPRATRALLAALVGAAFVLVQVPLHEYAHCALWWSRGSAEPCVVVFAPLGGALAGTHEGPGAGELGRAYVTEVPSWEHPVIYGAHFAGTALVAARLGRWVAMAPPARQRTPAGLAPQGP